MASVRDFIYLDVERVRSFVAQAGGGVPTDRTNAHEHQAGGEAGASGGLPFGLARVEGQADYRYVRSASETKSVQDAIFEAFTEVLQPLDVTHLPWDDPASLPDGKLISVRGHVKLIDYQTSLEALRAFPKVLSAYEKFSRGASGPPAGKNRAHQTGAGVSMGGVQRSQVDALGPLIEGMSNRAGTRLADFVRVKIVRDLVEPENAFVGDGSRESFRYPSALLSTLYPGGLAEGWQAVGLVHRPPAQKLPAPENPGTMGEMLESMLDGMQGLEAFRQAAVPPAIAITPLAIYRSVVSGD